MAPKHERTPAQKAEHQKQIAEMYIKKKMTQAQIAEALGIDQSTVSRDLKSITKRWEDQSTRQVAQAKAERLEELSMVKEAAWGAWDKSLQNAESLTTKSVLPKDPNGEEVRLGGDYLMAIETTKKVEGQTGNPSFLKEIREAIALEAKILGFDDESLRLLSPAALLLAKAMGLDFKALGKELEDQIEAAAKEIPAPKKSRKSNKSVSDA